MIIAFLSLMWAQPLLVDADVAVLAIEQMKTKDGFDVLWRRDVRSPIVRMEIFFPIGMKECAEEAEMGWRKKVQKQERALLALGGYAKFSMQAHQGYAQVSVQPGKEKQGLRWLRDMITHLSIPKRVQEKKRDISSRRHVDVVRQSLLGVPRLAQKTMKDCQQEYDVWLSRAHPRFLLVGALETNPEISFLDYFWPKMTAIDVTEEPPIEEEETLLEPIPALRLYDVDRMGQVELSLLVAIPKTVSFAMLKTYREILVGGFTSRLNMSLRETHGWVYSVASVLHYRNENIFLEITTQCSHSDLPLVRDEMMQQIQGMVHIYEEEIRKVLWDELRKKRERELDGMYQISTLRFGISQPTTQSIAMHTKENVQQIAQEIVQEGGFFWIVTGKKSDVVASWKGDWDDFVFQSSQE